MTTDQSYMKVALQLARLGRGQTSPNPMVGAIVVSDEGVIGQGAHLKAGAEHAEVHALNMAGEKAKGATLYVTLEPCCHFGRTGPCTDFIIKSGVTRVVVASVDPSPHVQGKGIEILQRHGLSVQTGVYNEEARALNRSYFHYCKTGEPYVTLKFASSLDGKTATVSGESKWITSKEARDDSHEERATHDAILVGINTVLADDPKLTARGAGDRRNPIRVIMDRKLQTPEQAKMLQEPGETWIFTEVDGKGGGTDVAKIIWQERVTVPSVLAELGKRGIRSLLVEGGAEIHGAFLKARRCERVISYVAPVMIGGKEATGMVAGTGIAELDQAVKYQIQNIKNVGTDIKITSVRKGESSNVHRNC
ncbi:bifunctional diaminohydroxyphosphoribosylaminopyrimidine deaminase/5-amino-6-(5-phosphoribosylamino)uracil reductase RibD [Geomicrobium sp. JCM 19039]|uniref:bifunctional diaminohydroxyphosphoribosylaminopyrimidine deaminase/5-amino-6-(5-phosphoribosylamino)uracil reductase RibD n=1 Tax=Geomicrobium sp. JCM 19039 TaxID=1460636 RepID=UPI00045F3EB2|nr:bifunctional diaminohydroxyphosphoribosylaminopyrimidine deaminase/5-amino-6-(5-phosphoribosylamino)uracil reductase RibD [Geomicrobium sp. JCM 19039]GAK13575.1 diaminohydroxyphosphoribosylaminopyrimidine deaminase [Geomicrobium sp. JCM 19039]